MPHGRSALVTNPAPRPSNDLSDSESRSPFFTQVRFVIDTIDRFRRPVDMGGKPQNRLSDITKVAMQVAVSLFVLILCSVLLSKSKDAAVQKSAFGLIGVVVGYWLR